MTTIDGVTTFSIRKLGLDTSPKRVHAAFSRGTFPDRIQALCGKRWPTAQVEDSSSDISPCECLTCQRIILDRVKAGTWKAVRS